MTTEKISRLHLKKHDTDSEIDIRLARLPSIIEESDFDPRAHRAPQKEPLKLWVAYFNVARPLLGPGILAMPLVISQLGMVLGTILVFLIGLLLIHTHKMLINNLYIIAQQLKIPYVSYRYGCRIALYHGPSYMSNLANASPAIIAAFMVLSQLGVCTVIVIFTSDSLRDICDLSTSLQALEYLFIPYVLVTLGMKNFKYSTYLGLIAVFLNLLGMLLVLILMMHSPRNEIDAVTIKGVSLLLSIGICYFSFNIIGVALGTEKLLTRGGLLIERYGILEVSMGLPILLSVFYGAVGYWSYGVMDENVLRALPFEEPLAMVAIALYMISNMSIYPLQCYPGIDIMVEVFKYSISREMPSKKCTLALDVVLRPCFVAVTFILAILVPFQAPFVALVGNICTTQLCLIFPALMEICIQYPSYGKYDWKLIKNLLIILLGLISLFLGGYHTINLIYVRTLFRVTSDTEIL